MEDLQVDPAAAVSDHQLVSEKTGRQPPIVQQREVRRLIAMNFVLRCCHLSCEIPINVQTLYISRPTLRCAIEYCGRSSAGDEAAVSAHCIVDGRSTSTSHKL